MQCYICYKAIEEGDIETLESVQQSCQMYLGNQCSTLPLQNTLGDEAMKSSMKLFPHVLTGKVVMMCVLVCLFLSIQIYAQMSNNIEDNQYLFYDNIYIYLSEFNNMSNRELIQFHSFYGCYASALAVINRAKVIDWPLIREKSEQYDDLLIRLHGYVTSMQTDFLFGSYVMIGPNRISSDFDIRVNFDNTYVVIGDEVIIFLIPVFLGNDVQLSSWEWIQITMN